MPTVTFRVHNSLTRRPATLESSRRFTTALRLLRLYEHISGEEHYISIDVEPSTNLVHLGAVRAARRAVDTLHPKDAA